MGDGVVGNGVDGARGWSMYGGTDGVGTLGDLLAFEYLITGSDAGFGDCADMLLQRYPETGGQRARLDRGLVGFVFVVSEVQATGEVEGFCGLRHEEVSVVGFWLYQTS